MSTSMSSGPIITHEPGRCQKKRFLNLWVRARESKLPVSVNQALGRINNLIASSPLALPSALYRR
jgi:hypothetical protein